MAAAIGVTLVVVGLGLLLIGLIRTRRAFGSEDWVRVPGRIVRSEVTAHGVGADRTHHLDLTYSYQVDGRDHHGSQIGYRPLWRTDSPQRMARLSQRYPEGANVSVHVDPSDPSRAVLEPGGGWSMFALPAAGLMFMVVGASVLL